MKKTDLISQFKTLFKSKEKQYSLIQIKDLDFYVSDQNKLSIALKTLFNLCSIELDSNLQKKLKNDFKVFIERSRWVIHNTFNGGVFLREPERILKIDLELFTVNMIIQIIIEFDSEIRNSRNQNIKKILEKLRCLNGILLQYFLTLVYIPKKYKDF